jgi:hypothetical protein
LSLLVIFIRALWVKPEIRMPDSLRDMNGESVPGSGDKARWKARWITEAFQTMKQRFPRLKAAVYWNERWQNEDGTYSNLRTASSPRALEAYRNGVRDSFWLDRPLYR